MAVENVFGVKAADRSYRDRPAAYAVILDKHGRVAVVRGRRGLFLPGGGTDPGESAEETLRREAKEEIARELILTGLIGTAVQYFTADGIDYRLIASFYAAELSTRIDSPAEYELEWVEVEADASHFFHECHVWAVRQASNA